MSDPPGRDTRTARSDRRQTWYGHGQFATAEKDGFGRWLDDVVYAFAEVSIAGLPILYYLMLSEDLRYFGVKATALVAWVTFVVGAATIRGGWITPLRTDVPGWVSLSPALVVLRLVYYNAALAIAAYGSVAVAASIGVAVASMPISFVIALVAVGAFPRIAQEFYRVVLDWKGRGRQ